MSEAPRKRGAPLGNQNAFRHGAYSKTSMFSAHPHLPPDKGTISLSYEIAYLRAYYLSLARAGSVYMQSDPEKLAFILRSLAVASLAITRLIQMDVYLVRAYGTNTLQNRLPEVVGLMSQDCESTSPPSQEPAPAQPLGDSPLPHLGGGAGGEVRLRGPLPSPLSPSPGREGRVRTANPGLRAVPLSHPLSSI